ncbi:MAG: peptidoglycan DD-metalloendopeptidase family protein [Flavobacteriaceae bacterium]|nr:peptidoglycan DD-metalloendopeptidase family protein [Flavobacteriaceae bacterium]MBL6684808.1 peptidoglycan DD-metalloendopeptidase family protein [Flavobacteriaceae bacterium]
MKIRLYIIIILMPFISIAQTQKIKDLENERKVLKNEILEINSLLINNSKKKKNAFNDLESLAYKINRTETLIKLTNDQINLLNFEVEKNEDKIDKLNVEIIAAKKDYSDMIFNSYKSRLKENRLMFLLSAENFLQAFKRSQYFEQFSKNRKEMALSIQTKVGTVKKTIDTLKTKISKKDSLINFNLSEKKILSNEKKKQDNLIRSLRKRESAYKKQINDKQRQASLLDKEIDRLIKEAIKESNKNSSLSTFSLTPEAKALAESFSKNKGKLPWPVERGVIIQKFGLQSHPVVKTTKIKSNGIVIATTKNANIRSVFNGKVLSILKFKGSSLTVLIQHGNYISVYKNLSKVYVNKGQNVESFDIIGEVFSSNSESKTTLQFSIFNNTTALDPYLWIAK